MWGKAGQRSLERSALVEAAEQLTRALEQIAQLSPTPAFVEEQISSSSAHSAAHPVKGTLRAKPRRPQSTRSTDTRG